MIRRVALAAAAAVIAASLVAALAGPLTGPPPGEDGVAFHATLADPRLYGDGTYSGSFAVEGGEYRLRFVPSGSSPQSLSISITGGGVAFEEDYALRSELHRTGISEYYTWSYDGRHEFSAPGPGEARIVIDPHGDVDGAVTVDVLRE